VVDSDVFCMIGVCLEKPLLCAAADFGQTRCWSPNK
jgi:hypothetical protein